MSTYKMEQCSPKSSHLYYILCVLLQERPTFAQIIPMLDDCRQEFLAVSKTLSGVLSMLDADWVTCGMLPFVVLNHINKPSSQFL